jgi:hypothetical protein
MLTVVYDHIYIYLYYEWEYLGTDFHNLNHLELICWCFYSLLCPTIKFDFFVVVSKTTWSGWIHMKTGQVWCDSYVSEKGAGQLEQGRYSRTGRAGQVEQDR